MQMSATASPLDCRAAALAASEHLYYHGIQAELQEKSHPDDEKASNSDQMIMRLLLHVSAAVRLCFGHLVSANSPVRSIVHV